MDFISKAEFLKFVFYLKCSLLTPYLRLTELEPLSVTLGSLTGFSEGKDDAVLLAIPVSCSIKKFPGETLMGPDWVNCSRV